MSSLTSRRPTSRSAFAEEFAYPHLDAMLQNSQIPSSADLLGAVLASRSHKVLLIESMERLLEKSTRDAFADLLELASRDRTWRLVLTCRDYSTDLVRTSFLEYAGVNHALVSIPPLEDGELGEVRHAYPSLARPLASPALCPLLRNPYVLGRSLQIDWSEEHSLPEGEREFRQLFWRQIIRAEHDASRGLPQRREAAFIAVALRRAQSLTLYASCPDLDRDAVDSLRKDGLLVSSPGTDSLVAPAHDLLEDWAILQWIYQQYQIQERSLAGLSDALGTYPAIRRSYRKWINELVDFAPEDGGRVTAGDRSWSWPSCSLL